MLTRRPPPPRSTRAITAAAGHELHSLRPRQTARRQPRGMWLETVAAVVVVHSTCLLKHGGGVACRPRPGVWGLGLRAWPTKRGRGARGGESRRRPVCRMKSRGRKRPKGPACATQGMSPYSLWVFWVGLGLGWGGGLRGTKTTALVGRACHRPRPHRDGHDRRHLRYTCLLVLFMCCINTVGGARMGEASPGRGLPLTVLPHQAPPMRVYAQYEGVALSIREL